MRHCGIRFRSVKGERSFGHRGVSEGLCDRLTGRDDRLAVGLRLKQRREMSWQEIKVIGVGRYGQI